MTLRKHKERKTYSADFKHRTFGRKHLSLKTKVKDVAITRHAALEQLLDTGEPVRDIVDALFAHKLTIEAVTECLRLKRPFDTLRPSTWPTLGAAIELYVESQREKEGGSQNTAQGSETALKHASAHFGDDRPLDAITYDDVTGYKQYLREQGLGSNTVGLYMLKFGALYTFLQKRETRKAAQQKRTPAVLFSPMDREEHIPATVKTRKRFLNEVEAERLLLAAPASFRAAVAIGLFAGLRVGEVVMLRPGIDVDLEQGVIYVQTREGWTPKYKKNREVPISSALEPYLVEHMATLPADAPYLFGGRAADEPTGRSNMFLFFRKTVDDAELSRTRTDPDAVSFHTLRHTFASWLVMAGADLFTVARLLGHTSTKQVEETYGHLSPGHRLATVEMLSTKWLSRPADTLQIGSQPPSIHTEGHANP